MKSYLFLFLLHISFSGICQTAYEVPAGKTVGWEGHSVGGGGHTGTLKLLSGLLIISDKSDITKGQFMLDMTSIRNSDNKDNADDNLDEHLKSDDFFSTAKFPTAFFAVTSATLSSASVPDIYTIKGLLSLRGITSSITFQAVIKKTTPTELLVTGDIAIDRTKWDVVYKAEGKWSSILNEAKDNLISNEIKIHLNLIMLKAGK